ncbi:SWIB-domain-containing protein [Microstroma glucosiphilum]|uniref:SWIB-domain-containing protein n=1 Tax=Pseudomicrostroma glucosiphilum TaxID=1684307 RepID=A0A316U1L7_9BASI|nr:SWIB-domain-containing protein [Pseudomicrostroma glucosiphilum]PWN19276.1 SWIB-domain-containing protein [Pseudomicrostroma glucosiphilum]
MANFMPPSIRTLIFDLLAKADLAAVTPGGIRGDLESIQTAQKFAPPADSTRHIPADFDFAANKKEIKNLIKECYEEVAARKDIARPAPAPASAPLTNGVKVKSEEGSAPPSGPSTASSPPRPAAPSTSMGLALPGLGGVRGSHAPAPSSQAVDPPVRPPPSTDAQSKSDAALAAKLAQEWARPSRDTRAGSSTSSSRGGASKKRKQSVKSDPDDIDTEEDSDVESNARKSKSSASKKAKKVKSDKPRAANPNNPFNKPMLLDAAMAEICGAEELPRHGVVKQLWAYIKERDLQNANNKRQIMCDEKLQKLFGKATVDSFEMAKLIGAHIRKKEDVVGMSDD